MDVRRYLTGEGAYVERHYLNGLMQVVDEAVLKGEGTEVLPKSPAQVVKPSKKSKKKKKKKSKRIVAKIFSDAPAADKHTTRIPPFAATFCFRQPLGVISVHGSDPPEVGCWNGHIFPRRFWLSSETVGADARYLN